MNRSQSRFQSTEYVSEAAPSKYPLLEGTHRERRTAPECVLFSFNIFSFYGSIYFISFRQIGHHVAAIESHSFRSSNSNWSTHAKRLISSKYKHVCDTESIQSKPTKCKRMKNRVNRVKCRFVYFTFSHQSVSSLSLSSSRSL